MLRANVGAPFGGNEARLVRGRDAKCAHGAECGGDRPIPWLTTVGLRRTSNQTHNGREKARMGAKPDSPEWKAAEKIADAVKRDGKNSDAAFEAVIDYANTPKDNDKKSKKK